MDFLIQHVEALIFTTEHPISLDEIKDILETAFETTVEEAEILRGIDTLHTRYQAPDFAFELIEVAGGFQFMTKPAFHHSVGVFLKKINKKRLSQAALETLSIVAYKQPVSKNELELIRGVSCDYALQKLLEKELIEIKGRSESVGKPLLYGTSARFMDYFGIKSLDDLPRPKDFKEVLNQIGEAQESEG